MKFIIDNILLIAIVLTSALALILPVLQRRGKKATPLEATLLINKQKALVLDVRGADEFAAGHLRDAKNIPAAELGKRVGELASAKSRPVIVVCQSGVRSSGATALLLKAGFADAFSLDGGMKAWSAANLPLTKE